MSKLNDKVAVITGGSSGIGLATAQRFVAEGAYVFITGRRQSELDRARKVIGRNVTTVQSDVAKLDDLDRLYSIVKKEKGVLHIVVANAGITELAPPSTATPEFYDRIFNILARGTFFTIQKAVPLMTAGGAIVTVGSVAYKKGIPNMTVYSSAKAAVRYSVKGWAAELIGKGIRVNAVSPGNTYFEGGIWQNIERGMPDLYKTAMSLNPTGRMGTAQEVAAGVVFLASPVASRISGTNLVIDGALTKAV